MSDEISDGIQSKLDSLLPDLIDGKPILRGSLPQQHSAQALQKALAVQAYGLAAGHVSSAKTELHQLSCFRWSSSGTREVCLLCYKDAAKFLKKEKQMQQEPRFQDTLSWAAAASVIDFKKLLEAFPQAIHQATVGPHDLVYIPAGAITFHRVFPGADVYGIRCGVLGPVDAQLLPMLLDDLKAHKGPISEILTAACALFQAHPELFVMKAKVSAPAPGAAEQQQAVDDALAQLSEEEREKKEAAGAAAAPAASGVPEADVKEVAKEKDEEHAADRDGVRKLETKADDSPQKKLRLV